MKDLFTRALDAHGGLSRGREMDAFQVKVSIGGGLWRLTGLPDGLHDVTLRVQAHRPRVTITPVRWRGAHRTLHARPRMDRGGQGRRRGGARRATGFVRRARPDHTLGYIAGTLLRELRPVELPGDSVRVHRTRLRDP